MKNTVQYDFDNDIVSEEFKEFVNAYLKLSTPINSITGSYITRYIIQDKPNRLSYMFDNCGIPSNLTLKEKIVYFQLLES